MTPCTCCIKLLLTVLYSANSNPGLLLAAAPFVFVSFFDSLLASFFDAFGTVPA